MGQLSAGGLQVRAARYLLGAVATVLLLGLTDLPASAGPTDGPSAFCDAALELGDSLEPLESGEPTEAELERIGTAVTQFGDTAPAEVAADAATVVTSRRDALTTGQDPFADTAFVRANQTVDEFRFASCGYQTADVTLREYEFVGMPRTFSTGTVAIKLTNTGVEEHEMEIARLKTREPFRKVLALPAKQQRTRLDVIAHGHDAAGTTYLFADLDRAGRYGASCSVEVATVSAGEHVHPTSADHDHGAHDHGAGHDHGAEEHDSAGTPHWRAGMRTTFTVT